MLKKLSPLSLLALTFIVLILCPSELLAQRQKEAAVFGRTIDIEQVQNAGGVLKCVTPEYELYLQDLNGNRSREKEFERWLDQNKRGMRLLRQQAQGSSSVITIPVVVHVIHNNKPYGVEENILDEQVLSQIQVLNQDFRRMMNTPGFNSNPVGADVEIEFCLAQRSPTGAPTNGINRVSMAPGFFGWNPQTVDQMIKPQTIWNPEEYLNIWVVSNMAFFGIFEILGYAQFPSNSTLQGLDVGTGEALTDGVVIGHKYFGSSLIFPGGTYEPGYSGGRTTTHEVGHWLGLRHIWGDTSECFDDGDYCDDTPPATDANDTCTPNFECGAFNMIENYMDYTPDTCQNVFTEDQKTRMQTVMYFADRRFNLLNSEACIAPQSNNFDLSLKVQDASIPPCSNVLTPQLLIENLGTQITVNSFQITYSFNNGPSEQILSSVTLAPGASTIVTLPSQSFDNGVHTANFALSIINGGMDEYMANNSKYHVFRVEGGTFNTQNVQLTIQNDNYGDETTWEMRDSQNNVVASGGPYADNALIQLSIPIVNNECYSFTIFDDFGDGICCSEGQGFYELRTDSNQLIKAGATFASSETTTFGIDQTLSLSKDVFQNAFKLYPNPAHSLAHVTWNASVVTPEKLIVYNALGVVVHQQMLSGDSSLLEVSSWSNGIYLVQIIGQGNNHTIKFVKQ